MRNLCCMIAMGVALAGPASAALSDETSINARLQVVATADAIRKGCSAIEPRMVRAYAYLRRTARDAQGLGYSRDAIEAYVEDDAAKAVIEGRAREWLAANGGLDEAGLCARGRAEIAGGTEIGKLLKAR